MFTCSFEVILYRVYLWARGAIGKRPMWFDGMLTGTPSREGRRPSWARLPLQTNQSKDTVIFEAYSGTYWVTYIFIFENYCVLSFVSFVLVTSLNCMAFIYWNCFWYAFPDGDVCVSKDCWHFQNSKLN